MRCACRLLRNRVHSAQQAADVIGVITNAKGVLDVFGHAGTGPKIGGVSRGLSALQ